MICEYETLFSIKINSQVIFLIITLNGVALARDGQSHHKFSKPVVASRNVGCFFRLRLHKFHEKSNVTHWASTALAESNPLTNTKSLLTS